MSNLVNLEAVTKSRGTSVLLDEVTLGIAAGERIGVVGRNGGGKSTLVTVLTRNEPVDAGRVTHVGGLRVGVLPQVVTPPPGATVRSLVLGDAAEHEWAGDARVREVLAGLGLPALGFDSAVVTMSGGERRRVALAALLVNELDLVVLDEPTNHLDVEGIEWLARHLTASRNALLVVTHDRWFLDEVCTTTWEVGEGAVRSYDGGYSAYVLARAERERQAASAEARRQNLLRKELAWLRRGPPARTSKPKFRIDAANALIDDVPPARDAMALRTFATARLGKTVYDVEDATLRVGDRTLLDRVTWLVGPGDRIGIVGVNGSGKTSLLRLLVGDVEPAEGRVVRGVTVRLAYLSQEVAELDGGLRVLEAVEEFARSVDIGGGRTLSASQLLERFGYTGGAQWTRVGDLSGGERRRLQLLRLLMSEPNVLLLDEPTNDLDIDTLQALEDVLDSWPGTLLVVSHDRYLLERTTDRTVALLGDGRLSELPGGVDDYLARRRATDKPPAAPVKARSGDTRAAKKELVRLERALEKLDQRATELHAEMAEKSTDYAAVSELDAELRELEAERARTEDAWLELSESLD